MRRVRVALRVAGLTVFAVLALALVAVGGLWTFAESDWGGDVLRRVAVTQIDKRIAGQVAIGRLRFGGDRLTLEDVVLRDPEGTAVASVGGVEVAFSPWALLRKRVEIGRLEIRRPELQLGLGARGS
ncbi:MAG TPA: hypothetical protein VHO06_25265, partial [Polyangia bacterium]|nr:hypothetical protein [Polyangia bacterium]